MASSASKSNHSKGAEFGDGTELTFVSGESNINSGETNWGSSSPVKDCLVVAGDITLVVAVVSVVIDVDLAAVSEPGIFAGDVESDAYIHSLSDLVHVMHRGRCSSHLTLVALVDGLIILKFLLTVSSDM